jgi:hypothetical protein
MPLEELLGGRVLGAWRRNVRVVLDVNAFEL